MRIILKNNFHCFWSKYSKTPSFLTVYLKEVAEQSTNIQLGENF